MSVRLYQKAIVERLDMGAAVNISCGILLVADRRFLNDELLDERTYNCENNHVAVTVGCDISSSRMSGIINTRNKESRGYRRDSIGQIKYIVNCTESTAV